MAANYKETRVFSASSAQLSALLKDSYFCTTLNLELKSENPSFSGVWYRFHHGVSFSSWGEKITITLTAADPSSTQVEIYSECGMPTQMIDFGKNKRVVCNLFEYIERNLSRYTAAVQQAVPAQQPVAPARPSGNRFCTNCGQKAVEGASFCGVCGTRI